MIVHEVMIAGKRQIYIISDEGDVFSLTVDTFSQLFHRSQLKILPTE